MKRSYKERKKSRPSVSVPLRGNFFRSSGSPGLPPFLLPALQGDRGRGGGLGVHLVLRSVRLPPLLLDLGPVRWVEVSLDVRLLHASAPPSLQLLRELQRGRLLVCSGLPLPALLPWLLLPAHRRTIRDVISGEMLRWTAPVLNPPVFPDLRIEEQRRIVETILVRTALVTVTVVLALAPLTVCG